MFEQVAKIVVRDKSGVERRITLALGDLARIDPAQKVDLLVVSALPGDYAPTPNSLIGQLAQNGVSVADLATMKDRDLRESHGAWLSMALPREEVGFRRLAVFEPETLGPPPQVVSQIFRALFPFLGEAEDQVVAMPLIATGNAGWPVAEMAQALLDAAEGWLELGLPVRELFIVTRSESDLAALQEVFATSSDAASAASGDGADLEPTPSPTRPDDPVARAKTTTAYDLMRRQNQLVRQRSEGETLEHYIPPWSEARPPADAAPPRDASGPVDAATRTARGWVGLFVFLLAGAASAGAAFWFGLLSEPLPIAYPDAGEGPQPAPVVPEPDSEPVAFHDAVSLVWLLAILAIAIAAAAVVLVLRARRRTKLREAFGRYITPGDAASESTERKDRSASVFLSFSSRDAEAADRIVARCAEIAPHLRVFDFRRDIPVGTSYQREIDAALAGSDRVVCLLSPDYMASPECEEELMVARLRNKRAGFEFLAPIYWREIPGELAYWLQILNYADCREGDLAELDENLGQIVGALLADAPSLRGHENGQKSRRP